MEPIAPSLIVAIAAPRRKRGSRAAEHRPPDELQGTSLRADRSSDAPDRHLADPWKPTAIASSRSATPSPHVIHEII
ncbi:MAG: hypothetical protein R3D52_06340 [Xanthobacteraceae bacterium]